jgi:anti-sigma factor RsiW
MDHQDAIRTQAAERYLLDEMSEAERHEFESHYFDCVPCAADVREGAMMADAVKTSNQTAAVLPFVAPAARAPRPASQWLSIAAAGLLAIVAGYQALVVIPGLRDSSGAQALTPVVLRSVSRGDLPVVPRPAPNALVSLAMDVNIDPMPADLVYTLKSADGRELLTGPAPIPQPGSPLLLVVPGRTLAAGRYEIQLRGASDAASTAASYRFEVR